MSTIAVELRREATLFFRFCTVGAAGFLAEAGVLTLLHYCIGIGPLIARAMSSPLAVLLTFILNRNWSFSPKGQSILRGLATYATVQAAGFICNIAIYTFAVTALPRPLNEPTVSLAIASAIALAINYTGTRFLVFGRRENFWKNL